jgi:3-oxoacyl-[acyl-carrier-protein] synthase II
MEQVTIGLDVLQTRGPGQVSPFAFPALSCSMAACQLSMEYGATGPVITQSAACATSIICFHDALRMIQRGEVDVVLAGGTEAPLLPMGFAALGNMHALSRRNDEPQRASRPFDKDRDGFVYGEGAGVVVVESAEHALKRGANIVAEVVGTAMTADAFHISAPEPTGRGATMAMTKALADGAVAPDEIDLVVAHGTSTPLNDLTETRAIKNAFGEYSKKVTITAPKSMVGHMIGAAGVISALVAFGAMREGVVAPTINLENPDLPELDLDYTPRVARQKRVDTAMINGFGFGGQNAVAVFRRFEA